MFKVRIKIVRKQLMLRIKFTIVLNIKFAVVSNDSPKL